MIWNLIQQIQLGRAERQATTTQEQIDDLEQRLRRTEDVLIDVIRYLERRDGRDLDGDGEIG
jgi:hypothetical protein